MWFLPISILVTTTILAIPLSRYLAWIMDGKYRPPRLLQWFEDRLNSGPLDWKQYTAALLIFNTVLFVFGFIVLALQPWMPLNGQGKGMLAPSHDFSQRRVVHDQHRRAALFRRPALFQLQSDLLRHRQFLLVRLDRVLRVDGDHPRAARRQDARQLLRRYVARRDVHLPAGRLRSCRSSSCSRAVP